jgi:hypothetical protein
MLVAPAVLALGAVILSFLLASRLGRASKDGRVLIWVAIVLLGAFALAVGGCYSLMFFASIGG